MQTIWKFELKTTDNQTLEMPIGAEILTVQTQNEHPCIWAIVDPNAKKAIRNFEIFGTGHPMDEPKVFTTRHYVGTYQIFNGAGCFHVFEILNHLS